MSQRQEGWLALPYKYDDGGFTGANIERPALRKLLADQTRYQSRSCSGKGVEQRKLGMLASQGLNLFLIILNRRSQIAQDSYQCRRVAQARELMDFNPEVEGDERAVVSVAWILAMLSGVLSRSLFA